MFPGNDPANLEITLDFPYQVVDYPTIWIPLSDGTKLAARLWRPVMPNQEPVPAVFEYIPYRRRDGTLADDERIHPYFAGHGFASLRVDLRGSGDSEGLLEDEYLKLEQDDALDVIAWIAEQPWCDGNVGMMGISWGGFNSLQVAARRPAALKAIIAIGATVDRYNDDVHYKNGCMLNENFGWASSFLSFCTRPPDPAVVGDRWREMWLKRLENLPFLPERWLSHPIRDDYWKHGSVCEDYSAIEAATMIIAGWGDAYVNAVPRLLENLEAPCYAISGPWAHQYPHLATPGPAIDFLGEAVAWWTQWLKGDETAMTDRPKYRAYLQTGSKPNSHAQEVPGHWIGSNNWPNAALQLDRWYLTKTGLSKTMESAPTHRIHSPVDVGLTSGEFIPHCLGPEMPQDQRLDDAGSVVFDSEILIEPYDIWGDPVIELMLSSDCSTGNLIVRLCDVGLDGSSHRVTWGVLNLTHREGNAQATPLPENQPVQVQVWLDHVAHRFPAGHKIRIALSTAYWPLIWPASDNPVLKLVAEPATLDLPVIPTAMADQPVEMGPPVAPPPANLITHRPALNQRQVIQDQSLQQSRLEILDDYGRTEFADHGMMNDGVKRERYRIKWDDVTSTTAEFHWTHQLGRGDWQVRTETKTKLTSDAEHHTITGLVTAYEGERELLTRRWSCKIPRN